MLAWFSICLWTAYYALLLFSKIVKASVKAANLVAGNDVIIRQVKSQFRIGREQLQYHQLGLAIAPYIVRNAPTPYYLCVQGPFSAISGAYSELPSPFDLIQEKFVGPREKFKWPILTGFSNTKSNLILNPENLQTNHHCNYSFRAHAESWPANIQFRIIGITYCLLIFHPSLCNILSPCTTLSELL